MRDPDIRKVLLLSLKRKHPKSSGTLLVEEFGLCQGDARVDLAVINGIIHGYEIKSERDSLARLSAQQEIYSKVLDRVTVIAGTRHLSKVEKIVPVWWEIFDASFKNDKIKIEMIRPGSVNNSVDPSALVQLLWREEALLVLKERNLHMGMGSKSRKVLWTKIVENLSEKELKLVVREKIKARQQWRKG